MTNFRTGEIVYSDDNRKLVIRYPKWEDLDLMVEYINTISFEDTYILLSGELINKRDEAKYLSEMFWNIESNNAVLLLMFVDNILCGIADITRDYKKRKRSLHFGIMGISIASKIRGNGFGYIFADNLIKEAKKRLYNLKSVELDVFGNNLVAQNLYKKLGFREVGRVPNRFFYQNQYTDQIIMNLSLV